jgi:hypothetical protein
MSRICHVLCALHQRYEDYKSIRGLGPVLGFPALTCRSKHFIFALSIYICSIFRLIFPLKACLFSPEEYQSPISTIRLNRITASRFPIFLPTQLLRWDLEYLPEKI